MVDLCFSLTENIRCRKLQNLPMHDITDLAERDTENLMSDRLHFDSLYP